jgi:hypothetical protein
MSEWNDEQLDGLVRAHLSSELDGQSGRAEAAFLRHLAAPRSSGLAESPTDPSGRRNSVAARHVNRFRGWTLTFAGAALAASLAALAAAPALFENNSTVPGPGQTRQPPTVAGGPDRGFYRTEEQPLLQYVHSRTWDEGTVVLEGDVPARRVRHQWLERTHYFDPEEGVRKEITIPRENIRYIEMDTY